jgi:diaminohydroxyphosphoribosylaminopyrimidine deaminase/5-amino-6-(5-phosphoribosylamino)uracil reductase
LQLDEKYIRRCFDLAKLGEGLVAPNPIVGAVLVYNHKIIGEGYHQAFGAAHAEVNCINSVKAEDKVNISKSTLYVSLEPCSHFGKTPPCANLIIKNKIPRVVISTLDPNILVTGNGIQKLIQAGIEVETGILEDTGKALIEKFIYFHKNKKTYITLKYAESIDGYVSKKNEQTKISNPITDRYVHQLRAEHQAILIGKNTLDIDNPKLNIRLYNGKNPIKIILSSNGNINLNYKIFEDKQTPIFIVNNDKQGVQENINWVKVSNIYNLDEVLHILYKNNIQSILVEGGASILNNFIAQNKWNQIIRIVAEKKLESGILAPKLNIPESEITFLKSDKILKYKNTTYE